MTRRDLDLPLIKATEGNDGYDISKLLKETGYVTLDLGFVNTASCHVARSPTSTATRASCATAATRSSSWPRSRRFLEVSYLLIYGELPTHDQLDDFDEQIRRHTLLHEDIKRFFDGFPRDAHPMAILSSVVSALSTFYQDSLDPFDTEQVEISTVRLLAKLPTIAAYAYKKSSASRSSTRTTRLALSRTSCA